MTAKMHIDGCQVSKLLLTYMEHSYVIYIISLQTVPACQNLYKNSFIYHCLQDGQILQFDDAMQFLGALTFVLHYEVQFVLKSLTLVSPLWFMTSISSLMHRFFCL